MLQYNLTVERQLPFSVGLTLGYAGSRGLNLLQRKEGNPTIPQVLPDGRQFWTGTDPRLNPNWDTNNMIAAAGNSFYNALQFLLTKRLTRGLEFQSSYTWAKLFDETQGTAAGDGTTNNVVGVDPTHRKLDRGPADFDVSQNWRFNAIYHLPNSAATGIAGKLLNGWWTSGILSLQSGYPFTPVLGSNRSRSKVNGGGGGLDRPDLIPGRNNGNTVQTSTSTGCTGMAAGTPIGAPALWFDPCAFTVPAIGFLGTSGRNILRGPGFANLDFSLVKDTSIRQLGESGKLEFRLETFNILNHPNFAMPSPTVFAATQNVEPPLATAGRITSTATTSRQIQLALKLIW